MKVDIDYQSNPLPNRPSSQDKHLWQKKTKSHDGVSPHQLRFSSWHSHHLKGLQGVSWGELFALSFLPQLWMGNLTVWVRDRSDVAALAKIRRSGQARLGPILRGKAKEYRLSGTFASSWCLGAINPSPSHVSLHRTEAKGSLFSVFGFISREKTRYAFIQQEETVPCLPTFWTSAFYALLRTKKIMDGCFSYQNEAQS